MKMLESHVERKFSQGCKKQGCKAMKIIPTETGMPDRCVFLGQGRCVFIELKQSHGTLRPKQRAMHARLMVRGYRVYTLFGASDVDWFLNEELPLLISSYWPQAPARQGVAGGAET
jgi:hypothetical protein